MDSDPEVHSILLQLLLLLILTLVNAFFAGAEMAVVSVNKGKIRRLASAGNRQASLILSLSENSTSFLSTIQVAITFAGFFSSASAATGISRILAHQLAAWKIPFSETLSVITVTLLLSYFTLVFGELVPKRIALQKAESFSLLCVRPVYAVSVVMAPFIRLLSLSTNGFLWLIGMRSEKMEEEITKEEIRSLLEAGQEAGVFNTMEKEIITSIFSFDHKKAREVMIPRQEMTAIDLSRFSEEQLNAALRSRRSRIPVYDGNMDTIVGILPIKELMIRTNESPLSHHDLSDILQKPYFVPENQKIDQLFKEMQSRQIRMAILIDEYGGVSGLVTLEDLIEEIVGDIWDEYEEAEQNLIQLDESHFQIPGNTLIQDLNRTLHLHLTGNCDTLSGYLIEKLGYIPDRKELPFCLDLPEVSFTVTDIRDRVITSVKAEIKVNKEHGADCAEMR